MDRLRLVYLGNYRSAEREALSLAGVSTVHVNDVNDFGKIASSSPSLLRADRMSATEYEALFTKAGAAGLRLVTSPKSFRIGGDLEQQYKILRRWSPVSVFVPRSASAAEILGLVTEARIKPPIFVRTEVESAAKYVGLDGCLLKGYSKEEVERVVGNLRRHVGGFKTIVLKEVVEIESQEDGERLEYRAIGLRGRVVGFDYDPGATNLPDPEQVGLTVVTENAFNELAGSGADGALFVDIARLTNGTGVVVECKNFYNGSIRAVESVGRRLGSWSL